MARSCIVHKRSGRIVSVRTPSGLRSRLFDKIASIPIIENRDRAYSFFKKVFSSKFLKKFGNWLNRFPKNPELYKNVVANIQSVPLEYRDAVLSEARMMDNPMLIERAFTPESIREKGFSYYSSNLQGGEVVLIDMPVSMEREITAEDESRTTEQKIADALTEDAPLSALFHTPEGGETRVVSDKIPFVRPEQAALMSELNGMLYETGEPRLFFVDSKGNVYDSYGDALMNENREIRIGFLNSRISEIGAVSRDASGVHLNDESAFIPIMSVSVSTNPTTAQGAINYLIKKGYLRGEKVFDKDNTTYRLTGKGELSDTRVINSARAYYKLCDMLGQRNVEINEEGFIRVRFEDKTKSRLLENGREVEVDRNEIRRQLLQGRYEELKRKYDNFDFMVVSLIMESDDLFHGSKADIFKDTSEREINLRNRIMDVMNSFGIRMMGMSDYLEKYGAKHGSDPSVRALADLANGVIAVSEGANLADVAEEISHFMVEAYTDQAAVSEALNEVEGTREWNLYASEYYATYSRIYEGDALDEAVRREILGKILKNRIIGQATRENVFTRLIRGIQNFLRGMVSGQRSEMDSILSDMENAFMTNRTDAFNPSLLAQSTFTLYSQGQRNEMVQIQKTLTSLRKVLNHLRQIRASNAISVDTTIGDIERIEKEMADVQDKIDKGAYSASVVSIVTTAEAQASYLENLVSQIQSGQGDVSMRFQPSDRINMRIVNEEMLPVLESLRASIRRSNELSGFEKNKMNGRIDDAISRMRSAMAEINYETGGIDSDFLEKLLVRFGVSEENRENIKNIIKGTVRDMTMLSRFFGILEKSANMVNRMLGKIISNNNLKAVTAAQPIVRKLVEAATKHSWKVSDNERLIEIVNGKHSSYLKDELLNGQYDYNYRIAQMKALKKALGISDDVLSDKKIREVVESGDPYTFTIERDGKKKDMIFRPSMTRSMHDVLTPEQELVYKHEMNRFAEENDERPFTDEYYEERNKYYDNVEKETGVKIGAETREYLDRFYRNRAVLMAPFWNRRGENRDFDQSRYRKSSARMEVMHLEKARRMAASSYLYMGGSSRVQKTGSQLQLARELQAVDEYNRNVQRDKASIKQRFLGEIREMMRERDIYGTTTNQEIFEYLASGGHFGFSSKFWDSLKNDVTDADGMVPMYEQLAREIDERRGVNPDTDDSAVRAANTIKERYETIREILRFNRDATRPQNTDFSLMTKSEMEAIQSCVEDIQSKYRTIYSLASQTEVDVSQYRRPGNAGEAGYNDSFEAAYRDSIDESRGGQQKKRWEFAEEHMLLSNRNKVDGLRRKLLNGFDNKFNFTSSEAEIIEKHTGISANMDSNEFRNAVNQYFSNRNTELESKIDDILDDFAAGYVYPYFKRTQPRGYDKFMKTMMEGHTDWIGLLEAIDRGSEYAGFDTSLLFFEPNRQNMDEEDTYKKYINPYYDTTRKYGYHQPKRSKYENKEFNRYFGIYTDKNGVKRASLHTDEYEMLTLFKEVKMEATDDYNSLGRYNINLITQKSKSNYERIVGMGTDPKETAKNYIRDKTMDRIDESQYGTTVDGDSLDPSSRVRIMPKYFMNELENQSNLSHDFVESYSSLALQSKLYKAKQESMQDVYGLENILLNMQFENGKKASDTNSYKMFKDFLDAYFFGIHLNTTRLVKNIGGYRIDFSKIMMNLDNWMRTMNLGLSPAVAATGAATGQANFIIEAASGQYFSKASAYYAVKETSRLLPSAINEIGDIDRKNKIYVLGEKNGIFNMLNRVYGAGFNKVARLVRDPLYKPMEILNYPLGIQVMISVMDNIRVYNGSFVDERTFMREHKGDPNAKSKWESLRPQSLWNLSNVDSNGVETIDASVLGRNINNEEDRRAAEEHLRITQENARSRIMSINQTCNGALNEENRTIATRNWALRHTTAHRGWMTIAAQKLMARRGYNFHTGQFEEGLVTSLYNYSKRMIEFMSEDSYLNIVGAYQYAKRDMTDEERTNMKRSLVYLCAFLIMQGLGKLMFGWRDDDDNDESWMVQFASYIGMRTINELSSQMPLFLHLNIVDAIDSPFVMARKLNDLTDIRNLSFDEVTSGTYKGETYAWRTFCKMTFLKQFYNFSTPEATKRSADWWLQTNRASMAFFWGANRSRRDDRGRRNSSWFFDSN